MTEDEIILLKIIMEFKELSDYILEHVDCMTSIDVEHQQKSTYMVYLRVKPMIYHRVKKDIELCYKSGKGFHRKLEPKEDLVKKLLRTGYEERKV